MAGQHRGKPSAQTLATWPEVGLRPPAQDLVQDGTVPIMGTKAERRAASDRVSTYHQAQLAELITHVVAAIDRYRDGQIDAFTVDATLHHYHRAAGDLWKFCFSRGAGSHVEFIASILDRMTAGTETSDWWERATPRRQ